MQAIEVLKDEHKNILEFADFLKKVCCSIIDGEKVDTELLRECVAFARNYADKFHHGKEEEILFKVIIEQSGDVAQKLIRHGMLVEHDLARYHVLELENSILAFDSNPSVENKLNILTHAGGYIDLIKRHIEKEDMVVYDFAKKELSEDALNDVGKRGIDRDSSLEQEEIKNKYLSWLKKRSISFNNL